MQPVPIGVIGELLVGGAGIANGYVNLPELTREKFIVDPFSPESGRAFKTGDLARLLPDGNIAFFGRRDYQVKIHGFRIELGEIEAALEAHPAIQACIIQPWEAVTGQPRLVAYCVYKPDAVRPSPAELRQFLSASLPHFMLPAFFMVLDALPLTPSGKVNRRVLPPPG